jgi:hypothetical protein
MWALDFISEEDLGKHIRLTIQQYGEKLKSYGLKRFNSNIIDPVKLIFDKTVYRYSWDEIIKNEIFRQRDKSNTNDIGYFHQRLFQYIKDCEVPEAGWDVIFKPCGGVVLPDGDRVSTVYVEMKNKHNTMNSASSSRTFMKMQSQLLDDDDCACFLVEAIAKRSQNIPWTAPAAKKHKRIRRVSMDAFYSLVTGQEDAFYNMCMVLPPAIERVVEASGAADVPNDTVIDELKRIADDKGGSFVLALYMLGFGTYSGFSEE